MALADKVIKSLGGKPHRETYSKKKHNIKKKKKSKKNEASSFGTYSFINWKKGKPNPSALYDELSKLGYEFLDDYEYDPIGKGGIIIINKKMGADKKVLTLLKKLFNKKGEGL